MSTVVRMSISRTLFARACSNKTGASRAVLSAPAALRPTAARLNGLSSLNILRSAVATRPTTFKAFQNFHCSAMAFDAEVGDEAPAAAPTPSSTKLYVGNLSWNVQDEELKEAFGSFGSIQSCEVVMDMNGRSRGFGFVEFEDTQQCQAAIEAMNNQPLDGREVRVDFHVPRARGEPRPERPQRRYQDNSNRVYVGNLPWTFDDFDLQDTFEEFGTVVDAKVIIDRETGRSRGFGFVTLSSEEEVDKSCAELDGSVCEGRSIRVNRAER